MWALVAEMEALKAQLSGMRAANRAGEQVGLVIFGAPEFNELAEQLRVVSYQLQEL